MKNIVKVTVKKCNANSNRNLTYDWIFKNQEVAEKIIEKMEEKFKSLNYLWRFERQPWIYENGKYGDAIVIPFENGKMTEYKRHMAEMWNEVKKEMGIE